MYVFDYYFLIVVLVFVSWIDLFIVFQRFSMFSQLSKFWMWCLLQAGKTVVTTIHQPSSRMFNMFDKLILLGKGSSLYYGKASEAMLYFSSIGCSPLIPMNPAEFLIDLANGNLNDKSVSHEIKCHDTRSPSSADIHRVCLCLTDSEKLSISITLRLINCSFCSIFWVPMRPGFLVKRSRRL